MQVRLVRCLVLGEADVAVNAENLRAVQVIRLGLQAKRDGLAKRFGRLFIRRLIAGLVILKPLTLVVGAQVFQEANRIFWKAAETCHFFVLIRQRGCKRMMNMGKIRILCHCRRMKKTMFTLALLASLGACATNVPYGPAAKAGAKGYIVQPIEANRFRVSYTDSKLETARTRALRRAAEITHEQGDDWFQIVAAYDDMDASGGNRSSVSIGGGTHSGGRTSVGLGVGIGFPLGGSSGPATHVLEIITGSGDKPDDENTYLASDVLLNLAGQ